MSDEKKTYCGIADAHGLESFFSNDEHEDRVGILIMRAGLNRQRHAVYYEVELTQEQIDEVNALFNDRDYIGACKLLHDPDFVESFGIAGGSNQEALTRSWEMIPDPSLDPYWSSE